MLKKEIVLSYVIQIILSFSTLVMGLIAFFDVIFLNVTLMLISFTFITIGFNYYTINKEKLMAALYFLFAIVLWLLMIFKVV